MSSNTKNTLSIFEQMSQFGHQNVVFCNDVETGLKAIIAIHDTTLGPALGGTRMWSYANEQDALQDVLRLSRGMTYKAAITGLNLGGGKAVIIGDSRTDKSEAMMRRYGKFIKNLNVECENFRYTLFIIIMSWQTFASMITQFKKLIII